MQAPDPNDFHSVNFLNLRITEPVTASTDLVITIVSVSLFLLLQKKLKNKPVDSGNYYWPLFFLFMGLSTLAGSIAHGFRYYFQGNSFFFYFSAMNIFSCLSSFFAQLATYKHMLDNNPRWLRSVFIILLIFFLLAVLYTQKFMITNIFVILSFLFVLITHILQKKVNPSGARFIINGILIAFLPAFVFLFKISISDIWFNHKDLAHVFIIVSLIIMYKGARLFQIKSA